MATSSMITGEGMVVYILADGAQPAQIDLRHFHLGSLETFRIWPAKSKQFTLSPCGLSLSTRSGIW